MIDTDLSLHTHDVCCYECSWRGRSTLSDEYERHTWLPNGDLNPDWQPGDVFDAFSEPCPQCGEESVTLDLSAVMEAVASYGMPVPAEEPRR